MNMIKTLIFLLSCCVFCTTVSAQNPKIIKARSLLNAEKTSKAISLLNKSFLKSGEKDLGVELIHIYIDMKDHVNAQKMAGTLGLATSETVADATLYSDLLIASGDYSRALEHCLSFIMKQEDAGPLYDRAYTCRNLLKAEKNAIKYKVAEVPYNTWADEISIANYRKNYVMSSNRVNEAADRTSSEDYFDLFMLKQDFGKWRYPYFLLQKRDAKVNRTTLCYSVDGNQVFYTLSNYISAKARKKAPDRNPDFTIYEGISMGDSWEKSMPASFGKDGFSYKDPALHPQGNLLVFSSNEAGHGGFDLFATEREKDDWSTPINLGPGINTAYDETMAYFDESGRLFFSSSDPLGFGGYDIYQTKNDNGIWLRSEILPPPINSAYDDLSYTGHYGRSGGYITSNRPGGQGGYDIYEFFEYDYKMGVTVLDASNGSVLGMAEIQLSRDGIDLEQRLTSSKGLAEFSIGKNAVYEVTVQKEGYLPGSETISTDKATQSKLLFANVRLQPDPAFKPVTHENEQLFNNQNFIQFTAHVTNAANEALPDLRVKLVNLTSNRMKLITTDANGSFSQSLYLGNDYTFTIEYDGDQTVQQFSTRQPSDLQPVEVTYVLQSE
ncbi:MAG: carboxypeptidase regulatory-like domain-containing protein [Bacteroidetes bacterium]|nr:carboxypeptidase regulatory-like domain-containing protein [Bacteroidota bacterium]